MEIPQYQVVSSGPSQDGYPSLALKNDLSKWLIFLEAKMEIVLLNGI